MSRFESLEEVKKEIGRLKVGTPLVCEDVREEKNGDLILVGVKNFALLVKEFPFQKDLKVVIPVTMTRSGLVKLRVRIEYGDGDGIARGSFNIAGLEHLTQYIVCPPIKIKLDEKSSLTVRCAIENGRLNTILRMPIAPGSTDIDELF